MSAKPLDKPKLEKKNTHGGYREGSGRPAFVPTAEDRKQVELLSGMGLPQDQIATLISGGISIDTLRKHFESELIAGKAKANSQVAKTLFQKATSGDTTAAIWWSKTQMKWSEVQRVEHSGVNGNPIQIESRELFDSVLKNIEATRQIENSE